MRIGNRQRLEHALNGAVLARMAVQHHQRRIGAQLGKPGGDGAIDVDPGHLIATALQRIGAGFAGAQRDLPFG